MAEPNRTVWETDRPPLVTFRAAPEAEGTSLRLRYSVRNETGEPILVFWSKPPLVRVGADGRVTFLSLMPELTPWSLPIAPHIPPVLRLGAGESADGEAVYELPLRDTHPYPAGPSAPAMPAGEPGLSGELHFIVGYFPEKDGNKLWDGANPGEQVASYYDLKRQFLTGARPLRLSVPVWRPS